MNRRAILTPSQDPAFVSVKHRAIDRSVVHEGLDRLLLTHCPQPRSPTVPSSLQVRIRLSSGLIAAPVTLPPCSNVQTSALLASAAASVAFFAKAVSPAD
jgi:hypothetical protein